MFQVRSKLLCYRVALGFPLSGLYAHREKILLTEIALKIVVIPPAAGLLCWVLPDGFGIPILLRVKAVYIFRV